MALQKQIVSIPLVQGIDTKSDSKQQVPGSLLILENGRFTSPGQIVKRHGHDALGKTIFGQSTEIDNGAGLIGFKDELLASTGTNLYSYIDAQDAWVSKGDLFNITIDANSVIKNDYTQTSQDSCYHPSGLQCFVWEDSSGGSRYSLIDQTTKLQVVSNQLIASDATKPKAFALGNYIVVLYHDTSEADINALVIPVANPTNTTIKDIITDPLNDDYDAAVIGARLFVAYTDGAGDFSVRYVNSAITVSSAATISSLTANAVTIFGDDNLNVVVGLWDGTDVKAATWDYDLNPVVSITTLETIANVKNITGVSDGTTATFFYDITNATVYNYYIVKTTMTLAGVAGTPAVFIRSLSLGSKAQWINDQIYLVGSYASSYQPTYFLLNESAQVAAKIAALTGGGIPAKNVIPQINLISDGVAQIAYLQVNTTNAVNGLIVSQTNVMQAVLDFTSVGLISTELAGNLLIGGGYIAAYDGANTVELGFHLFPEAVSLAQTTGGSIANGTYQYVAVYEWTDQAGAIHRSAPSIPTSITTTSTNQTVNVTIPTLRVTAKNNVVIHLYRTEAGGSVFYRITSITSPLFNNPGTNSVSYSDTAASSTIIGNNQLYTTGGVFENIAPPASEIFTNYKNRVVLIPADNKSQWWYSKEVVPSLPVEFSDVFVNNMDQFGGDITAVGVLDDKIVFFKENCKFYVYGNGPAANGTGGDFSFPERITSDTGCVNQRSIVSTPFGLFYQSPKGIYLLDRSLADNYIGSSVEAYTEGALVTSAILIADTNQVRMTLDSGVTLVYDYFVKQWSVDTGLNATDSTLFQSNRYALIQASGRVLIEKPDVYTDAGSAIKLKIKTTWLNFAQVNGYQRIYKMLLMGEYKSPHKLRVSFAENFNAEPFQIVDIDALNNVVQTYGSDPIYGSMLVYGGEYPSYQFRVFPERQKSTSLQVTIEDIQIAPNYGQAYSLSNMAFEVGTKSGLNKLKAGASYG